MKFKVFLGALFLAVLVAISFNVTASKDSVPEQEAFSPVGNFDFDKDSLVTSSTLDTTIQDLGIIYSPQAYTLQIRADSVSGSTNATCYLQVATDMGSTDYANIETVVINGVQTIAYETGTVIRGHLRCACYAPSSTQKVYLWTDFATYSTVLNTTW